MPPALKSVVAMLHVASLPRSIAFYGTLGFRVANTFTPDGQKEPTWAWLAGDGADLMLTQATAPVVPEQQAVLFYLYCTDVDAMHAELGAAGLAVGPICKPFYSPKGEFAVTDPDGYALMLTHT